ncbi:hypothetical protein QUA32_16435 [Microcoleus sp. Pol14D6]
MWERSGESLANSGFEGLFADRMDDGRSVVRDSLRDSFASRGN